MSYGQTLDPGIGLKRSKFNQAPNTVTPNPSHRRSPIRRSELFANHGGSCLGCGGQLGFWFVYKICDKCIQIIRPERSRGMVYS